MPQVIRTKVDSLRFRAGIALKIVVGCDMEEFKRYYRKLAEDKEWQGTFGFTQKLGASWERAR